MKLLQKTSRTYLIFSGILLLLAGTILFLELTGFIRNESKEKLLVNKDRIVKKIAEGKPVAELPPVIEIDTLNEVLPESEYVKDTLLYDPVEKEKELFLQIYSLNNIHGKSYRIIVRQVIPETGDYLSSIGIFIAAVFAILLLGLYVINRRISAGSWKHFFKTLEALEVFSVENDSPIPLPSTDIEEFQAFNKTVDRLIQQVRSDYASLKAFTADASHEIQTPLAIIQLRLEEALQVDGIPEESTRRILSALSASQRLSRLNRTLLLLAKIEQHGQEHERSVNPAEILDKVLEQHQEFFENKKLTITRDFHQSVTIEAHVGMLEILLNNLLNNAVKYCPENSTIGINLSPEGLVITNPGPPLKRKPEELFNRFAKDNPSSSSPGLGLSIVKKICEVSSWQIQYTVIDNIHHISIHF